MVEFRIRPGLGRDSEYQQEVKLKFLISQRGYHILEVDISYSCLLATIQERRPSIDLEELIKLQLSGYRNSQCLRQLVVDRSSIVKSAAGKEKPA